MSRKSASVVSARCSARESVSSRAASGVSALNQAAVYSVAYALDGQQDLIGPTLKNGVQTAVNNIVQGEISWIASYFPPRPPINGGATVAAPTAPVRLFEVAAFRKDVAPYVLDKLSRFDQAVDAYDAGDWDGARKGFEAVLAVDPADAPAQTFLTRTEANRSAGLGPGWDGVFEMKTK